VRHHGDAERVGEVEVVEPDERDRSWRRLRTQAGEAATPASSRASRYPAIRSSRSADGRRPRAAVRPEAASCPRRRRPRRDRAEVPVPRAGRRGDAAGVREHGVHSRLFDRWLDPHRLDGRLRARRFTFRLRRPVIALFLLATLVPGVTTQVATFQVVGRLGLFNTRWSAIALFLGTDIISIYIFQQFLRGIPRELDEAAALRFKGAFSAQWEVIAAGAILVIVPTLLVFLALQRFIYNGLTTGATR
jgi:hypothetical protein